MTLREFAVEMEVHTCDGCGIVWAVSSEWCNARRKDHKTFYCPNGCSWHYPAKSEKEKLQEDIETLRENLTSVRNYYETARAQAEHNERRFCGLQGYVAKLERRLEEGESP